jgi:hypothetical protein
VRRSLLLAGTAILIIACYVWWPHIRNEFFVIAGNRNESGGWYGWWSGQAGGLQPVQWVALALFLYWHHTCHETGCFLPGRHTVDGTRWCDLHHLAARRRLKDTGSAHDLTLPDLVPS